MIITNIDKLTEILSVLTEHINDNKPLTITLDKTDLMTIHSAFLNNKIVLEKINNTSIHDHTPNELAKIGETIAEIGQDSTTDCESFMSSLADKIITKETALV